MCRPDGDDAVASDLAFTADVSCSIVSVVGSVGGGPVSPNARLFIMSLISSLQECISVYVPWSISSLCGDGVQGGITVANGSVVNGVLSVPGPLISIIACSVRSL